MPTVRVKPYAVSGFLRLLEKGQSVKLASQLMGFSERTGWRIAKGEHVRQTENAPLTRCPGCGCKPKGECLTCLGRALERARLLLAGGRPLDAIEIMLRAEFPQLTKLQIEQTLQALSLFGLST